MTVREITEVLSAHGIEEADWEALLLAAHYTGKSIAYWRADRDTDIAEADLHEAVTKRCTRYPLQYILGTWEFMGLPFRVREGCLIPRADTEILCEKAIELLKEIPHPARVLDLCTGSGCILASVLHYTQTATGTAVELSQDARTIAQENFDALHLSDRIRLLPGDIREDVLATDDRYDLLLSNPPYVTMDEMETLEPELAHEPAMALTDGANGLTLYHAIFENYLPHLQPDGKLLLEHGDKQADAVLAMGKTYGLTGTVLYDYGGKPRCTLLWRK